MQVVDNTDAIGRANEDILRAQQAKQVTTNPLVAQYFVIAKGKLLERFSNAKHSDKEELNEIHLEMQALERFQKHFIECINKGKSAEKWFQTLAQKTKGIFKHR